MLTLDQKFASPGATDLVPDPWGKGTRFEILADTDPAYRAAQSAALRRNPILRKTMKIIARREQLFAAVNTDRRVKSIGPGGIVQDAGEAAAADQVERERERRVEDMVLQYVADQDISDADLDGIWNDSADHVALLVARVIETDASGQTVETTDRTEIQALLRSPAWVHAGLAYSGAPDPTTGVPPGQTLGVALQQFILTEAARITQEAAQTARGALGNSKPSSAGAPAAGDGLPTSSSGESS